MRTATTFEAEILALIDASLTHAGYYIVQLKLADGQRKGVSKSLQLTAERIDGAPMSVADCTAITNTASALLDVKDPIEGNYDLEVASPGLERPLTALKDFETYTGEVASVELNMAQNGRKRFKGVIEAVDGEHIVIAVEGQAHQLSFPNMKSAHLVATQEMIRQLLKESEKQQALELKEASGDIN